MFLWFRSRAENSSGKDKEFCSVLLFVPPEIKLNKVTFDSNPSNKTQKRDNENVKIPPHPKKCCWLLK